MKQRWRHLIASALVLALCLGFSYFQSGAWLLDQPAKLCRSLFGWGYYLVAPALLLGSYILLFHRGRNVASCLVGTALLPVVFGAIMHIALCKEKYVNMDGILKLLWTSGNALESGGAVSASLAIMLVLLVPTMVIVHIRSKVLERAIEWVATLLLTIPAIVLVVGLGPIYRWLSADVLSTNPIWLCFAYVILVMPFAFRALAVGLNSIDVKTLVEKFGTENLPAVAVFGEGTLRAALDAGITVLANAPTPEAPSMVKAIDIYIDQVHAGKEVEAAQFVEDKQKEEFIRSQQHKLAKKSRARRPAEPRK